jgi:glyoxylase-like metal-dependent hydrolase (beta-lactamase superfamily II)
MESGGWQIELVNTGVVPIDGSFLGPPAAFAGIYEGPVNVVVLRGQGRTVLVDAGSGPLTAIWPGSTADPLDVDPDVLIATHLDFDHAGGFVTGTWPDGLEPAFPGKSVLVPAEAAADARAGSPGNPAPPPVVATLDAAGLVEEYEDGHEPAPGLCLRAAPGHRAGHSILEVGESFVHAADAFHHPLHVEHPDWDTQSDSDPELGLATRRALLAELADRSTTVVVSHVAGFGRIERAGGGFRWVPVDA